MPSKFWTEALLITTYLINRLPTLVLNWKSPFESRRLTRSGGVDVTIKTGYDVSSPPIQTFQPRRSTITTSKPAWLNNFVCALFSNSNPVQVISVAPSRR
ncbi:UNVERIFIED_CONTAM: hypothetical protein Sradi_3649400 [Sesamum radiatum]|uniref:Uncharacterized protein n=1 Tax=Sesamum radiatum TaxID=300843 RepID=A0AAW2QI95_SESRA